MVSRHSVPTSLLTPLAVPATDGEFLQWRSEVRFRLAPTNKRLLIGTRSTGKRRYGHPALTGVLPVPWLPIKKGQSLNRHRDTGDDGSPGVVLTLRKKYSVLRARPQSQQSNESAASGSSGPLDGTPAAPSGSDHPEPSDRSLIDRNPWTEQTAARPRPPRGNRSTNGGQVQRRLSFDAASGVIVLPEDHDWMGEDSDSDDYGELQASTLMDSQIVEGAPSEGGPVVAGGSPGTNKRYSTYYHHPERRKTYTRP